MTAFYLMPIFENTAAASTGIPARDAEIASCKSGKVRLERYSVFCLLQFAVKEELGTDLAYLNYRKAPHGKPLINGAYISLSHTDGLAACAVSDMPVGVDVEPLGRKLRVDREAFAEKILSQKEWEEYLSLENGEQEAHLLKLFSAKEALFKAYGCGGFSPSAWDTVEKASDLFQKSVEVNGKNYQLSMAARERNEIKLYTVSENYGKIIKLKVCPVVEPND